MPASFFFSFFFPFHLHVLGQMKLIVERNESSNHFWHWIKKTNIVFHSNPPHDFWSIATFFLFFFSDENTKPKQTNKQTSWCWSKLCFECWNKQRFTLSWHTGSLKMNTIYVLCSFIWLPTFRRLEVWHCHYASATGDRSKSSEGSVRWKLEVWVTSGAHHTL